MSLEDNLQNIQHRIRAAAERGGHDPAGVTLVAVTKTVEEPLIRAAYELGLRQFGENRTEELTRKQEMFPEADWHMIGRLQTNKVKTAVTSAALIHSLDRWSLAQEIDKRAAQSGKIMPCLVQLNLAGEPQKGGMAENELEPFLSKAASLSALQIRGLMMIAPEKINEQNQEIFDKMKKIFDNIKGKRYTNVVMEYLSVGMSNDFELAVAAGANLVRIGSAIFKA
jgi:pyridoxal phosphate enzyme (YggS family)